MISVSDILFPGVLSLLFLLMVLGTILKWTFLVDPPEDWSWYSHSILKKQFGADFLIGFNYVVGTLGFCVTTFIFVVLLKAYLNQ